MVSASMYHKVMTLLLKSLKDTNSSCVSTYGYKKTGWGELTQKILRSTQKQGKSMLLRRNLGTRLSEVT